MLELLKYEFRRKQGLIIGMFGISTVYNIYLFTRNGVWTDGSTVGLSSSVTFIMMLIFLSSDIKSLKSDLYKDTKYLTFSVPRSGYQYFGTKMLVASIEFIVTAIFGEIFLFADTMFLMNHATLKFKEFYWGMSLRVLLLGLLAYIGIIMLTYFSIIMKKGLFVTRKIGGLISFLIFVFTAGIFFDLGNRVTGFLKFYVNVTIPFFTMQSNGGFRTVNMQWGKVTFGLNIVLLIYYILFNIGLFFFISHTLNKEIDL